MVRRLEDIEIDLAAIQPREHTVAVEDNPDERLIMADEGEPEGEYSVAVVCAGGNIEETDAYARLFANAPVDLGNLIAEVRRLRKFECLVRHIAAAATCDEMESTCGADSDPWIVRARDVLKEPDDANA